MMRPASLLYLSRPVMAATFPAEAWNLSRLDQEPTASGRGPVKWLVSAVMDLILAKVPMASDSRGSECRNRAEYCFESTVSEERIQ